MTKKLDRKYVEKILDWTDEVRENTKNTEKEVVTPELLKGFLDFYKTWLEGMKEEPISRFAVDMHNLAALSTTMYIDWEESSPMDFFEMVSDAFRDDPPPLSVEKVQELGDYMEKNDNYYAAAFWLWVCHMYQYSFGDFHPFIQDKLVEQFECRFVSTANPWSTTTEGKKKMDTILLKSRLSKA